MAALDAWLVFEDEAGFSMTPPTTRTWSRRGHTPVVRVRGRSHRRLPLAATAFIADHSVSYSGRTTATMRTARLRSSRG
ncbi:hypothetical protein [Streptomyces sp. NBC_00289]|uniref:hypothetical protein n=1 Tax=Streptomyces sp. NBC_00289 TaxID=2975703 RepID=UPI00352D90FF